MKSLMHHKFVSGDFNGLEPLCFFWGNDLWSLKSVVVCVAIACINLSFVMIALRVWLVQDGLFVPFFHRQQSPVLRAAPIRLER